MSRILVPLDGSEFGEGALPLAAGIARQSGMDLELVTVHTIVIYLGVSGTAVVALDADVRRRESAYLEHMAEQVRRRFEIAVTWAVLDGETGLAIMEHALANPPELIVMTTHGRGGASRFFLGSTADRLVRELHRPFLLVRPPANLTRAELPATAHILVPLDGSQAAEAVIDQVARFFPPATTTIHLLRVVVPTEVPPAFLPVPLPPEDAESLDRELAAAGEYLDAIVRHLQQQGHSAWREVIVHQHPATAILEHAEAQRCDLIALATRGLGGVQRALFGSVADKVIRGAATPVLVLNPVAGAFSHVLHDELEAATADARSTVREHGQ
jgi:nucleotide-binding universal stress UspA family protein